MKLTILQWWPYENDGSNSIVVGAYTDEFRKILAKEHVKESFSGFRGIDVSENAFDETEVILNDVIPSIKVESIDN